MAATCGRRAVSLADLDIILQEQGRLWGFLSNHGSVIKIFKCKSRDGRGRGTSWRRQLLPHPTPPPAFWSTHSDLMAPQSHGQRGDVQFTSDFAPGN
ncbi:uncharacterized protein LOC135113721 isoform X2 [Scylla paramamosain]|uniref:uncharacterized protein LOC135113721 isoform X2 n=1 Tax=Scylla paramamosain TaxID=85552 RepID=UPI003082A3A8